MIAYNSYVSTSSSYIPIAEINPDNPIISNKGLVSPIKNISKSMYIGNALSVRINGFYNPIIVTDDQPLYVFRGQLSKMFQTSLNDFFWIKASDLKVNDYVVYSSDVFDPNSDIDYKYAKILGCFITFGIPMERDKNIVCFNTYNNTQYEACIREALKPFNTSSYGTYNWVNYKCIYITHKKLAALCHEISINTKSDWIIPENIIASNIKFLKAFVQPYIMSNKSFDRAIFFKTSGSLKLLMGLQRIFLKLGAFTNIYQAASEDKNTGKPFQYYIMNTSIKEINNIGNPMCWFKNAGFSFHKIIDVEYAEYDDYMYSLSTLNNSYCSHLFTLYS